jgi:hypothetical protein
MSLESFMVGGRCFVANDWTAGSLTGLNRRIANLMEKRGYLPDNLDPIDLAFGKVSELTMTFTTQLDVRKRSRIRRLTKSVTEAHREDYFKQLRGFVDSHPFRISFNISFGSSGQSNGFIIKIDSEPAVVPKIRQLNMKEEKISDMDYRNIISQNKRFVSEIVHSLGGQPLQEPEALGTRATTTPLPLIESSFIEGMPSEIAACLKEANNCFVFSSIPACAVMLRKSIEVAVTKKLKQESRDDKVYDDEGHEFGLGRKLDALSEIAPRAARHLDEIKIVKWLGDVSAHDPRTQITSGDLRAVSPLIRTFLADLQLKR